ncbi:MAG: hypothetical protein Q8M17_07540 [Actinomycetota bacterium]|nr:hypothetical protein [Actinomycetota bacterium]
MAGHASYPATYTERNETGCCPAPDVSAWDRCTVEFTGQPFLRRMTRSLLHVPVNMSRTMTALQADAQRAGVVPETSHALVLSRELSPWRAEHLMAVTGPVEGADNVELAGTFASRVFEGPFRDAGSWDRDVRAYAESLGGHPGDVYFCYTTCPACAKHYGKNNVIALARIA